MIVPSFKRILPLLALASYSLSSHAGIFDVYHNPDGSTKWQFVANTTGGLMIISLVIGLFFLVRAHRRALRANRALKEIKAHLEERVVERTTSLQQTTEQLQEREAYIRRVVNAMPVMLIGLNQELQITQWNHQAAEITGRPAADVLGLNLWQAYPKITLTEEQVRQVLESGETLHLKHAQRSQYSFDITIYPLDKQSSGLVILVADVTKQVSAETKLAERDKISAMGELASAMAYDISRPIETIFARVSTARQELEVAPLGPVKNLLLQEVETVRSSAQRAKAIAENLLELAGSYRGSKQTVALPPILDAALQLASELFNDASGLSFGAINIERHYAPELPLVPCYSAELEQVMVRLLRSAYYALNARLGQADFSPHISLEVSEFYDSVWIKLTHNGECLSPAQQLEIFQPFFALGSDSTSCPVEQRLSYSYYIITDHHQGQMAVTSDADYGTCFNIQLRPA